MTAAPSMIPRSDAGFTLTEVLVALTITSIITVTLISALQWGARALRVSENADEAARVTAVQAVMRRMLSETKIEFEINSKGSREAVFRGEPDSLIFVGPPPADVMVPGFYRSYIFLQPQGNGSDDLTLKTTLHRTRIKASTRDPFSDIEDYTLLKSVSDISFLYYGVADDDETAEWHDSWIDQQTLPELIKVDVNFGDQDNRRWSKMTIMRRDRVWRY